jgi:hypothetical protein
MAFAELEQLGFFAWRSRFVGATVDQNGAGRAPPPAELRPVRRILRQRLRRVHSADAPPRSRRIIAGFVPIFFGYAFAKQPNFN